LIESTTARARSASSRRSERANSCNPSTCSLVDLTRGRPAMTTTTYRKATPPSYDMYPMLGNPA
jgi:hypothetical protein